MAITDAFVLPADVLLQRVSEVTSELRDRIRASDGDYALSRANARAQTKVLSAEAAELLGIFREPMTIARAVARFSRGKPTKPERLLEDALPFLQTLIADGLLARAGSQQSQRIARSLAKGSDVLGWTVLGCVQTTEDIEVYQVRNRTGAFAALKLGRRDVAETAATIEREARVAALANDIGARLIDSGEWEGRGYVLMDWLRVATAQKVFAEFRNRTDWKSRARLRDLATAVLSAYARLHDRGIMHGDVHPGNVLIDGCQRVKLLDFGLARLRTDPENSMPRGGIGFFFEPEYAAKVHRGGCALTPAGEQYSIAAMLYLLVTGSHYLDFVLERDAMFRQIAEDSVVPFERRGITPWPTAECVLARALSKSPEGRFNSVHEFAQAWAATKIPRTERAALVVPPIRHAFQTKVLRAAALDGAYMCEETAPTCSLNHGSAGVAYALYRIACANDDAELLALADVWSERSIVRIGEPGAFESAALEITADSFDAASPYHGPGGTHIVAALVADARSDVTAACESARRFLETCRQPFTHNDVTFGRSGALLGSAFFLNLLAHQGPAASLRGAVRSLGNDLLNELWTTVEEYAPVGESTQLDELGIAHGWAGLLYATCCWSSVARVPLPTSFGVRARELASCAEPIDRGLRWRWGCSVENSSAYMPGWCNGSAGYVFLWDEAFRVTRDTTYLELAEGAAWHAWESGAAEPSLCCGAAGQAYALLRWYRRCGDAAWLKRARELADHAMSAAAARLEHEHADRGYWHGGSLYRGNVGLAVLGADLERPVYARMPMFECDGDADGDI